MDVKTEIADRLLAARRRTEELLAPVDDRRLMTQHDPLMSPLVWDAGHIAVYEELWLVQRLSGIDPVDDRRMHDYDAFETPRGARGGLPLMTRDQVARYRDRVDGRALELLEEADLEGEEPLTRQGFVYEMIIQHEHQHQETLLQALQMLPGGYAHPAPSGAPASTRQWAGGGGMVAVPGGSYPVGSSGHSPWDNEGPGHTVRLKPFRIDRLPVSCGEYRAFVEDGGYGRPELWLPAGWEWRTGSGAEAPKHWRRRGGGWTTERFGDTVPLDDSLPVVHVCWYEADAYARWAGGRLPTELEWEVAASWDPASGRALRHPWGEAPPSPEVANLDHRLMGCAPVGSLPAGASPLGCEQMIGDVWEWTASDFLPYPGFRAFPYREYSEVFFGAEHRVLRGASWAARSSVGRASFRNWDYPIRRQIFAGFRCAADVDAA